MGRKGIFAIFILIVLGGLSPRHSAADEAASSSVGGKSRQKVIDFEDDLVEGMNKQPLDSLSQIGQNDKRRKKPHLYRKRAGFKVETEQSVREARLAQ